MLNRFSYEIITSEAGLLKLSEKVERLLKTETGCRLILLLCNRIITADCSNSLVIIQLSLAN